MISQVIQVRRPLNGKLVICGPVLADIQWPTDDDIMYSVCKQNKESRDFLLWLMLNLLVEMMRMFRRHKTTPIASVFTYVAYAACALTLISTSLLISAWMRAPFPGVGCTN